MRRVRPSQLALMHVSVSFAVRRAAVSLIAGAIMGLLFMSELMQYLTPERVDTLRVDPSVDEKLRITFNISFPALSCAEVMIDAMDVAGDQQLQIDHAVFKTRLDAGGGVLGEKFQENITADVEIPVLPDDYCGSCYGARGDGEVRREAGRGGRFAHHSLRARPTTRRSAATRVTRWWRRTLSGDGARSTCTRRRSSASGRRSTLPRARARARAATCTARWR